MASKRKEFNILENKQLVHIISEVIVLIGLTFYFSSKNKKLMGHIEELAQRLEEQEDHIQKLENSVQQLTNILSQINQRLQGHDNGLNVLAERIGSIKVQKPLERKKAPVLHVKPVLKEQKPPTRVSKIQFKKSDDHESDEEKEVSIQPKPVTNEKKKEDVEQLNEDENNDLSDSDLDDEISEELAELEEEDNSLKKGK